MIEYKDDKLLLSSEYLEVWNDNFVFVSLFENIVILVDMYSLEINKIFQLEEESCKFIGYRCFAIYKDNIILVPFFSNDFFVLNLLNGRQIRIKKLDNLQRNNGIRKYLMAIRIDNFLWCIGQDIHEILCLDLDKELKTVVKNQYNHEIVWSDTYIVQEKKIYIPAMNRNNLMIIDCNRQYVKIIDIYVNKQEEGFWDIISFDNSIYLYDKSGNKYMLNSNFECVLMESAQKEKVISRQSISNDEYIYRVAVNEYSIIRERVDGSTFEKRAVNASTDCFGTHIHHGYNHKNYFYFQTRYGQLFKINLDNMNCEEIFVKVNSEYMKFQRKVWNKLMKQEVIYESDFFNIFGLQEFITEICKEN